jgi:hypothetical protein
MVLLALLVLASPAKRTDLEAMHQCERDEPENSKAEHQCVE